MYYRQLSLSASTKRSYSSQLKSYLEFCENMGYDPVPVKGINLLRYTAFLSRRLAPQSVSAYLNVVRLLHLEANLPNPLVNNFPLDSLLKGIKKEKGVQVKQAFPVTPHALMAVSQCIDLSSPYWQAFWAACLVGFFAFLRKSNLFPHKDQNHHLQRQQVVLDDSGQVCLNISSTKTIQCRERVLTIPLPTIPSHPLCPVAAVSQLLKSNPKISGSYPLFSYNTPLGIKAIGYNQFVKDLRICLEKVGFPSKVYSGHSLRRGGASFALQCGVPGEIIKVLGDWRSEAYQRYLDTTVQTRKSALSKLVLNLPQPGK